MRSRALVINSPHLRRGPKEHLTRDQVLEIYLRRRRGAHIKDLCRLYRIDNGRVRELCEAVLFESVRVGVVSDEQEFRDIWHRPSRVSTGTSARREQAT